jgi:hypothetical protein
MGALCHHRIVSAVTCVTAHALVISFNAVDSANDVLDPLPETIGPPEGGGLWRSRFIGVVGRSTRRWRHSTIAGSLALFPR